MAGALFMQLRIQANEVVLPCKNVMSGILNIFLSHFKLLLGMVSHLIAGLIFVMENDTLQPAMAENSA